MELHREEVPRPSHIPLPRHAYNGPERRAGIDRRSGKDRRSTMSALTKGLLLWLAGKKYHRSGFDRRVSDKDRRGRQRAY